MFVAFGLTEITIITNIENMKKLLNEYIFTLFFKQIFLGNFKLKYFMEARNIDESTLEVWKVYVHKINLISITSLRVKNVFPKSVFTNTGLSERVHLHLITGKLQQKQKV